MQSVMNHARNFNNLLIEVEAYGYTVDETIVSLATTIYTSLEVGDMLNTISRVGLHSVIQTSENVNYPQYGRTVSLPSYLACGTVPRLTPPSVMSKEL
jgi:hypothetical protein